MNETSELDIIIPNQGLTITEIQISKWHKKEGDALQKGDVLFEFESDKAVMEMPCPADGVLKKIIAPEGEIVAIGGVVGVIASN